MSVVGWTTIVSFTVWGLGSADPVEDISKNYVVVVALTSTQTPTQHGVVVDMI